MGNAHEELEQVTKQARADVNHTLTLLEGKTQVLANDLLRVSEQAKQERMKIAEDNFCCVINELGEVQGQGLAIDLLCAKFNAQLIHLSRLTTAEARA